MRTLGKSYGIVFAHFFDDVIPVTILIEDEKGLKTEGFRRPKMGAIFIVSPSGEGEEIKYYGTG